MAAWGSSTSVSSRRAPLTWALVVCLLGLLLSSAVFAQNNDPVQVVPLEKASAGRDQLGLTLHTRPLRIDVNMVLVPVTAIDAMNHPVTSLEQQSFMLFEGEQRQRIEFFAHEDGPISLGVLLDLSKSMLNKIDMAKRAVAEFFATAHPDDDYFVITFDDAPHLLSDATRSPNTLLARLAQVKPQGHTALLDAIYLGVHKLRTARYQRRALLIISDGGDNHSRYDAGEIKRLVQESDVQIYGIGIYDTIFKSPEEWAGNRLLTTISEATGGRTIALHSPQQLPAIAAAVGWELRNQYVLGYRPSNPAHDGKWRNIKVQLAPAATPPELHLHYKRGYLAPTG